MRLSKGAVLVIRGGEMAGLNLRMRSFRQTDSFW